MHLYETDCVNAQSKKPLYEKLLAAHPDGPPIYVVYGNTRYYRNHELAEWLHNKPLVQVFLPPCSPNLHLIEHLGKFLRQEIINLCFYHTRRPNEATFTSYAQALGTEGSVTAPEILISWELSFIMRKNKAILYL